MKVGGQDAGRTEELEERVGRGRGGAGGEDEVSA